MAEVQVSTIADFITACAQDNTTVKVTADLDFTGKSAISCGSNVIIDGDGHNFNNIALVNAYLFTHNNSSMLWIKNANINLSFIDTNHNIYSNVFFKHSNTSGTYRNNCGYENCNIKAKIYLANFTRNTSRDSSGTYTIFPTTADAGIKKCNFVIDIYYISAHDFVNVIQGNGGNGNGIMEDSIIKITLYDPNGWAEAGRSAGSWSYYYGNFTNSETTNGAIYLICQFVKLSNCGLFLRYKGDVNINSKVCVCFLSSISSVVNSYFVYENTGNISIEPAIYNITFSTYAFYDKTKCDQWYKTSITYHYSSSQFMGLTTAQCKDRSTFEGPTAILPFKLKQTT